jgi:hypothetical protein
MNANQWLNIARATDALSRPPKKTFPDAHFFVCHFFVIPFSVPHSGLPIVSRLLDSPEFRVFTVSPFRNKNANQSRPPGVFSGVSPHRIKCPVRITKIFSVLTPCRT